MSDTLQPRFGVNADELRQYDWQKLLADAPRKECSGFSELLAAEAARCEKSADDLGRRVYSLLYVVASFHPNYDTRENAYGPRWSEPNGNRSLMAEDLTDEDLAALCGILNEILDPDFRARVGDVLWECKRDYKAAQVAVRAFLEAAERQKTDDLWPCYTERLERAVQLAAKLGFGKPLHAETISAVEAAIREFETNLKSGLLCHHLMATALNHGATDFVRYATLSEKLAAEFAAEGNWDFSERYWRLAGAWHGKAKNQTAATRCDLAAAECFVSKAEKEVGDKKYGYGYAAHWMGRGLEALRQAKAASDRVKQIHLRFLELERLALTEFRPMDFNPDEIPGFSETEKQVQAAAVAHVAGYDFERAVTRLVHITSPTDVAVLRDRLARQSEEFIWDKIVGSVALDQSGKVADTLPPAGFGPVDVEEEAARKKMVLHAREIHWPMQVAWKIEPARQTIVDEHAIRRRDLYWLVAANLFIPPGHEEMYLRGIQCGFLGDWLVAMHLLIPQIEASLRHVLQQQGVVTSTLEADGIQKERDLNQLLWMPELENILGEGILFDLRGILIERFGHNMRNESAHGLMPAASFYQPAAPYLWWLILRLCWNGYKLAGAPEQAGTP